jgi:hypothetical protein
MFRLESWKQSQIMLQMENCVSLCDILKIVKMISKKEKMHFFINIKKE